MTYQPLYAVIDDGIGRRTTHSRHGRVDKITGWVNTNRGKAFDFEVSNENESVLVKIDLRNVTNLECIETNGACAISYDIAKPIVTAQEFRSGEL